MRLTVKKQMNSQIIIQKFSLDIKKFYEIDQEAGQNMLNSEEKAMLQENNGLKQNS